MSDQILPTKQDDDASRRAAIDLARQKVLASFRNAPENYVEVAPAPEAPVAGEVSTQPLKSDHNKRMDKIQQILDGRAQRLREAAEAVKLKKEAKAPAPEVVAAESTDRFQTKTYEKTLTTEQAGLRVSEQEWKKFHSAWQDYYRKYYENYYTAALQNSKTDEEDEKLGKHARKIKRRLEMEERIREEDEHNRGVVEELQEKIRSNASESVAKAKRSRHFVPIVAGLVVVLLFLFLQYNRFVVATVRAFVAPGDSLMMEMAEIDTTVIANVGPDPLLIIPKINVQVPIVFGIGFDHESQQAAMNYGVAHFAIPGADSVPGQIGNTVLSGHSSGDVFDRGSYKFIFAQLPRLERGDTIHINFEGTRYTYVITEIDVVRPTDVHRLIFDTTVPMLTLITCYPVGTARDRMLVFAEQVTPSPLDALPQNELPDNIDVGAMMPSTSPTFFQRLWSFVTGNGW